MPREDAYYILAYECRDCGMENEQGDLQWDEYQDIHCCPDCGSEYLTEKKVWIRDARQGHVSKRMDSVPDGNPHSR